MRNEIFHKLKSIGFKFHRKSSTEFGVILEYKYYPQYLGDNHFTLIIFINKNYTQDIKFNNLYRSRDFRLYIHDKNNTFISSPFQLSDSTDWNKKYLNDSIKTGFYRELRTLKLKRVC